MNYLVVGLGNIGAEYASTRHNMGFMVLDEIAKRICDVVSSDCRDFLKKEEEIAKIDQEIRKLEEKKSKIRGM